MSEANDAAALAITVRPPSPRIRLRPTPHARMLALVLLLMVVAAINYQSNAAWALVFAIGASAALSALHARRNLAGVTVAACAAPPVFAGELPRATITLSAPPAADVIDLDLSFPDLPQSDPARRRAAHVNTVAGGGAAVATVELAPRARGEWRIVRVRVATSFPLGLIEASRELPLALTGLVYPHPSGERAPAVGGELEASGSDGSHAGSDDFLGHRRYQAGDPHRHVDWKAHARGGPLLVKRFAGAGGGVVWCDWSSARGGTEARLSQLARWVVDAHRAGLVFGLRLPGLALEPERGAAHYHACLRALALHRGDGADA
jgi:uncharacterized protein (DUF58 family)